MLVIIIEARVSPRWIETADWDTKLEKIIMQKCLALFLGGCEASTEVCKRKIRNNIVH
ncbi:SusD/RagB family nutrient-binding outer membrane lipoprotein [Bacteroides sp.]|uniref:SusD/RagB family nutrient-binding outer membrane lipoprotein n=1 Tax=Bacteroides sp. TaxID=29523 RepID=UPI0025C36B43|nr:SusD/RagB family nutrient-binding outer membrane lipoprotein [Bacteroides sp.]